MDLLIHAIIVLAVLGLVWYLVSRYIFPLLPAPVPVIITVILVVIMCVWLLELLGGGFGGVPTFHGLR